MGTEELLHTEIDIAAVHLGCKVTDLVDALVDLELAVDVMKDRAYATLAWHEDSLTVIRIRVDSFNRGRSNEERVPTTCNLVLVVA